MKPLRLLLCLAGLLALVGHQGYAQSKKDDVAPLIKDLKNKDPKVRISAADELGHRGAVRAADVKDALPLLLGLVKRDKDAGVRKSAALAVGKVDPDPKDAVPVLIDALTDKSTAVRTAAATALGQFGSNAADAIPALTEAQKDKDRGLSRAAGMALRSIRDKKK
jgi:HEAT repeat protein